MRTSEIRRWVVRPVLERAKLWSLAAEEIVLGTGLCESGYEYLDQRGNGIIAGPAFGPWQVEASTYWSLWDHEITPSVKINCLLALGFVDPPPVEELHGNLFLGALMCRLKYLTIKAPLPAPGDSVAMAAYWKKYYNTSAGKGLAVNAISTFNTVCI